MIGGLKLCHDSPRSGRIHADPAAPIHEPDHEPGRSLVECCVGDEVEIVIEFDRAPRQVKRIVPAIIDEEVRLRGLLEMRYLDADPLHAVTNRIVLIVRREGLLLAVEDLPRPIHVSRVVSDQNLVRPDLDRITILILHELKEILARGHASNRQSNIGRRTIRDGDACRVHSDERMRCVAERQPIDALERRSSKSIVEQGSRTILRGHPGSMRKPLRCLVGLSILVIFHRAARDDETERELLVHASYLGTDNRILEGNGLTITALQQSGRTCHDGGAHFRHIHSTRLQVDRIFRLIAIVFVTKIRTQAWPKEQTE